MGGPLQKKKKLRTRTGGREMTGQGTEDQPSSSPVLRIPSLRESEQQEKNKKWDEPRGKMG